MNVGAFGENFPYSNFHDLNMDWIIKIAKDFLDQYTHIQETISNGEQSLQDKANELEQLLQAWYDTHSEDIADELAQALQDLETELNNSITSLNNSADAKLAEVLAQIPADYTTLSNDVTALKSESLNNMDRIPENTDFNTLRTTKYWALSASTSFAQTYINNPVPAGHTAYMLVATSGPVTYQTAYDMFDGQIYNRSYVDNAWYPWEPVAKFSTPNSIPANTNFNDLKDTGYYNLSGSTATAQTYVNNPVPAGNYAVLTVYKITNNFVHQIAFDTMTGYIHSRTYVNGTWYNWMDGLDFILRSTGIPAGTDFNDLNNSGYYSLSGSNSVSATYTNNPVPIGHYAIMMVFRIADRVFHQVVFDLMTGSIYTRWKVQNNFGEWTYLNALQNNDSYSFTPISANKQTANTGTNLRILSYNVANYNNDSAVALPLAKEFNLKKFISDTNADIVGVQEDREYYSEDKNSHNYLWQPIYPYKNGLGGVTIYTKQNYSNIGIVVYTAAERYLRYETISINDKTVLLISTHPSPGTDASATRLSEYTELFKWIYREITLNAYGTTNPITCPVWDYCIITGDFNSETDTDKTNLKALATTRGFTMANGGYLGWLVTHKNVNAIDNILVSENVTINRIEVYTSLIDDLYSDHVPITADVTLN